MELMVMCGGVRARGTNDIGHTRSILVCISCFTPHFKAAPMRDGDLCQRAGAVCFQLTWRFVYKFGRTPQNTASRMGPEKYALNDHSKYALVTRVRRDTL